MILIRKALFGLVLFSLVLFSCKKEVTKTENTTKTEEKARSKEELRAEFLKLRFGMFIHFNMATFNDIEWAKANSDVNTFNPTKLDIEQWAEAAESAKMKYAVLTTKHVDGFCLWDTSTSEYDIASTPLKGRDLVQEYVDAFRKRNIEPHLYYCVWDRTEGIQDTITLSDKVIIKTQLKELLTNYGKIPTLTLDGWGNCGTIWTNDDHKEIYDYIKSLQPEILITDHFQIQRVNRKNLPFDAYQKDPDGKAFITLEEADKINDFLHFEEPLGDWAWAPESNKFASHQGPTIQSVWFWKKSFPTDDIMSVDEIVHKRLNVLKDRNCNLLLNVAPNPDGLLDDNVVQRLKEVGNAWKP